MRAPATAPLALLRTESNAMNPSQISLPLPSAVCGVRSKEATDTFSYCITIIVLHLRTMNDLQSIIDSNNSDDDNDAIPEEDTIQPWTPATLEVPAKLVDVTGYSTLCQINLMDYMGKESTMAKQVLTDPIVKLQGHRRPVLFPHIVDSGKESRQMVTKHLTRACAKEGFRLITRGWEHTKGRISFKCQRAFVYVGTKTQEEVARLSEAQMLRRPYSCQHKCPFGFQIYFKTDHWCFVTGNGSPVHSHHAPKQMKEIPPPTEEELAYEHWRRPDTTSRETLEPLFREMCGVADQSFAAFLLLKKTLSEAILQMREIVENGEKQKEEEHNSKRSANESSSHTKKKLKTET